MKLALIVLGILIYGTALAQPVQTQDYWRTIQWKHANDQDVLKVYLDKFGNFYPSTDVPMDQQKFLYPLQHNNADDTTSASIYTYFKRNSAGGKKLLEFYSVTPSGNYDRDYNNVQEKILQAYDRRLHELIQQKQAKTIVFLIHGFNEIDPTDEYKYFERAVTTQGYDNEVKPVYIEIFWDGLHTNSFLNLVGIWKHAQNNTRWVSLAVRDLMRHLTDRLNFVIVTHSLGASVGTGALFNCNSKWINNGDAVDRERNGIANRTPAPLDVKIKLGMLAPAIPGYTTFIDFDKRSPDIIAQNNNINRIVIGYNKKDYATSKLFFSATAGATTLGCNYQWRHQPDEVTRANQALIEDGYPVNNGLLSAFAFHTPPKYLLQDHAFIAYMQDSLNFKKFLTALFQ